MDDISKEAIAKAFADQATHLREKAASGVGSAEAVGWLTEKAAQFDDIAAAFRE